jgi:pimeloyl-ACP methyl ester carboxylesterase
LVTIRGVDPEIRYARSSGLAASYPDRVRALVLFHAEAYAAGFEDAEAIREELAELRDGWGTREYTDALLESQPRSFASAAVLLRTPSFS